MRHWIPRLLLVGVALAAVVAFAWLAARRPAPPPAAPTPAVAAAPPSEAGPPAPDPDAGALASEPGPDAAAEGLAWTRIDLEDIRSALPDNLYWQRAVPTEDARVLEERAEEEAYWNEMYGKVLSGTATEEEIEAYYDHRHRVSSDYVEFAKYVVAAYGDELPARDVSLLQLAQRLHLARLAELPRKVEAARERKRQQDEARRIWREDEAAFSGE